MNFIIFKAFKVLLWQVYLNYQKCTVYCDLVSPNCELFYYKFFSQMFINNAYIIIVKAESCLKQIKMSEITFGDGAYSSLKIRHQQNWWFPPRIKSNRNKQHFGLICRSWQWAIVTSCVNPVLGSPSLQVIWFCLKYLLINRCSEVRFPVENGRSAEIWRKRPSPG